MHTVSLPSGLSGIWCRRLRYGTPDLLHLIYAYLGKRDDTIKCQLILTEAAARESQLHSLTAYSNNDIDAVTDAITDAYDDYDHDITSDSLHTLLAGCCSRESRVTQILN